MSETNEPIENDGSGEMGGGAEIPAGGHLPEAPEEPIFTKQDEIDNQVLLRVVPCVAISENLVDDADNPSGGEVGFYAHDPYSEIGDKDAILVGSIAWQDGVITRDNLPNGVTIEAVAQALVDRLEHFQTASDGKFACKENAVAKTHFEEGIAILLKRRVDRLARGVLNTHQA